MAGKFDQATRLGLKLHNLARVLAPDAADVPVGKALQAAARIAPKKRVSDLTCAELEARLDAELRTYTKGG